MACACADSGIKSPLNTASIGSISRSCGCGSRKSAAAPASSGLSSDGDSPGGLRASSESCEDQLGPEVTSCMGEGYRKCVNRVTKDVIWLDPDSPTPCPEGYETLGKAVGFRTRVTNLTACEVTIGRLKSEPKNAPPPCPKVPPPDLCFSLRVKPATPARFSATFGKHLNEKGVECCTGLNVRTCHLAKGWFPRGFPGPPSGSSTSGGVSTPRIRLTKPEITPRDPPRPPMINTEPREPGIPDDPLPGGPRRPGLASGSTLPIGPGDVCIPSPKDNLASRRHYRDQCIGQSKAYTRSGRPAIPIATET